MLILYLVAGDMSLPMISGTTPPPNSYFTFTAIDDHRALIFGGHVTLGRSDIRTDSLYLIDFNKMVSAGIDPTTSNYVVSTIRFMMVTFIGELY